VATAFMKWLERSPQMYDRGITWLTFGRLSRLWDQICADFIRPGIKVLELGCGTGGLSVRMAKAGAEVAAVDIAPGMLSIAIESARKAGVSDRIDFKRSDAARIRDLYQPASFDLIVSSLMMSELDQEEGAFILESCLQVLTPHGKMVILDEVIPQRIFNRWLYYALRIPVAIVTWLLTRTSTHPLRNMEDLLQQHGYQIERTASTLGGSLCIFEASPSTQPLKVSRSVEFTRLEAKTTLRTLLIDLWELFFRIIPPYPKVKPGLYAIGHPTADSPVVATGNFDLTVRRVVKALDGRLNTWLLVTDSAGVNVWCASGAGFMNSEKVIAAIHSSGLEQVVQHRKLILPQLCAVGVDGKDIRNTGWEVHWGPVRAEDILQFVVDGLQKTEGMRTVHFPILDRLEMVSGTLGFYGLLILVPVAIFWRSSFVPIAISMVAISYFYALIMPWLPGKDGLAKSIPLTVIAILGVILYSHFWSPAVSIEMFHRILGITALSIFAAGELQGMSPLMRGEQANWIPELMIAFVLVLVNFLFPLLVGWR
jgi:ubiquinone/menaquinone biosynthesis C-methylase UbiE